MEEVEKWKMEEILEKNQEIDCMDVLEARGRCATFELKDSPPHTPGPSCSVIGPPAGPRQSPPAAGEPKAEPGPGRPPAGYRAVGMPHSGTQDSEAPQ